MGAKYSQEKDLEHVANKIIAAHRPHLKMLKICYLFRDVASVSQGKVIAGMCCKVDDRNWSIHGFDILIEIAKDIWEDATDQFRTAIMDHELGHVGIKLDENGQPGIDIKTNRINVFMKKHDIEEFGDVYERHGAYHAALREFIAKFKPKTTKADPADPDEQMDV